MDREIVLRAQHGDRDAFARLAADVIGALDRLARLITRDPDLARDAVQEALVRAWRSCGYVYQIPRTLAGKV